MQREASATAWVRALAWFHVPGLGWRYGRGSSIVEYGSASVFGRGLGGTCGTVAVRVSPGGHGAAPFGPHQPLVQGLRLSFGLGLEHRLGVGDGLD